MDYQNEKEIDLIDLIFHLLFRWRSLLVAALIGFAALGSYKYVTSEMGRAENDRLTAEGKLDEVKYPDAYQDAMDALQSKNVEIRKIESKILELQNKINDSNTKISVNRALIESNKTTIETLSSQIAQYSKMVTDAETYLKESFIMNLDASAVPTAKKSYQITMSNVSADAAIDPVDAVLATYALKLDNATVRKQLAASYDVNSKYVSELYTLESDTSGNTITLTTYGNTEDMAKGVLNIVSKALESNKTTIAKQYPNHTLTELSSECSVVVNDNFKNQQTNKEKELIEYKKTVDSLLSQATEINSENSNYETVIANETGLIEDYEKNVAEQEYNLPKLEKDLPELEDKVKAKTPSQFRSLKDGIKFGIIGFFVGAILLAGIYCVGYLVSGNVHTADEISYMFNIPLLAVMNHPKRQKPCFIDKWFYSWRGDYKNKTTDEEKVKTLAVTLNNMVKKGSKVAVLTSAPIADPDYFADTLNANTEGITFITVVQSTKSDASAKQLAQADSVILLEQRELTKFKDVEDEVSQVKLLSKPVIGSIIC